MTQESSSPPRAWASSPRVLLIALAAWLVATLGVRPLLLPDEGRYANVAREMLHGDWLVPTLNGLPFFHKPPLFYWLDIAAMHIAGITPFAGRFGSFVGAWVMGATLYFAMRRWHGARTAAIGLLLLASCPLFFLAGQYANHDMLVGGLIGAAILAFARALDEPQQGPGWAGERISLKWLVIAWAVCGLAMLAKGLIGVVLPALVIGPWLLARGRWQQMLKLLHPAGLIAFAIVALPWFIAMQARYGGFNDYFFMEQHFRRFSQTAFNNVRPFWFFIAVLPLATLPWSAWIAVLWRRLRGDIGPGERGAVIGLYVWWVVAIVGFFSMPSSKLVGYVLPALAPWCALLALAVSRAASSTAASQVEGDGDGESERMRLGLAPRVAVAIGVLVCLGVVVGLAWKTPKSNRGAALALATQMAAGDKVVMVDEYFYDVPFYADLKQPAIVASRWDDPEVPRRDNWRKELFDAARFDAALGQKVLWPLARLNELSCGGNVWFVVVPSQSQQFVAGVAGAQRVFADKSSELWRAPARACP